MTKKEVEKLLKQTEKNFCKLFSNRKNNKEEVLQAIALIKKCRNWLLHYTINRLTRDFGQKVVLPKW